MKILLVEPFYAGSHKRWADGLVQNSAHDIQLITLTGQFWKWRMYGGAIALAKQYLELNQTFDIIICTDMLDVTTFIALAKIDRSSTKVGIYFHENQLTYPWGADVQERDRHYAFINYTSALAADVIWMNSEYHKTSFTDALPQFLKGFPDEQGIEDLPNLTNKMQVLPLGMDLDHSYTLPPLEKPNRAVLLWNHRWEYDKNPELFFNALFELRERGIDFRLIVVGAHFTQQPPIFQKAKEQLKDVILHWGFAEDYASYLQLLQQADILPVTAIQDFFGGSVVEAMYHNVIPLLPKRLAYLEHLPESVHRTFFYDDDKSFVDKLQRMIMNVRIIRNQNTRKFVERYDWQTCIEQYDKTFSACAE